MKCIKITKTDSKNAPTQSQVIHVSDDKAHTLVTQGKAIYATKTEWKQGGRVRE